MKIKICGITCLEDAEMVLAAGADMIGFNFYPQSPRYIRPDKCAAILQQITGLRASFTAVGVFVNSPIDEVREICQSTGLQQAQLSGDESVEILAALGNDGFKAMRSSLQDGSDLGAEIDTVERVLRKYTRLRDGGAPQFLLDSAVKGAYGGTGITSDWGLAAQLAGEFQFLLAGGLTPENVGPAIERVHPWGVDVASGVESRPGKKDAQKVKDFILNARAAAKQYE